MTPNIVVEIIDLRASTAISTRERKLDKLSDHIEGIKSAVIEGAQSLASALHELPAQNGWAADELAATFGLTLTAEAGVLISKASAGACMEVTVTYRRNSNGH